MGLPTVTIEIFDDIDVETFKCIKHLTDDLPDGTNIELLISSYGGLMLNTISIIEILKRFHTHAKIIGFACSAAAILAISCDKCSMGEQASMLLHSAWTDEGNVDDPGIKRCNSLQLEIIKNRCPDFDPEAIKRDTWLSAEECLMLHLVDNIYISNEVDFVALCKKYAAKLSYNFNAEEIMEDRISEVIEKVKEDAAEEEVKEEAVEEPAEKPKEHDLIDVIEKLAEELSAIVARVTALEAAKGGEVSAEEEEDVDDERERINSLYRSVVAPQACVAIGTTKSAPKAARKVDYKAFKQFINS